MSAAASATETGRKREGGEGGRHNNCMLGATLSHHSASVRQPECSPSLSPLSLAVKPPHSPHLQWQTPHTAGAFKCYAKLICSRALHISRATGGRGRGRERGMNCSRECEFLVRLCLWMATWFSFTLERRLLMSLRIRVREREREKEKKNKRER